jgi:hypothetical protein
MHKIHFYSILFYAPVGSNSNNSFISKGLVFEKAKFSAKKARKCRLRKTFSQTFSLDIAISKVTKIVRGSNRYSIYFHGSYDIPCCFYDCVVDYDADI